MSLDSKSFKSLISISVIIQLENYWWILKTESNCSIIKSSETLIDHTLSCCSIKVFHWWKKSSLLICGHKHKCLECTYRLWQFSKVIVVTSAPRSRTSLALGSCLGLQYPEWFSLVEKVLSSIWGLLVFTKLCVFHRCYNW